MPTIHYRTTDRKVDFPEGEDVNLLRVAIRNDVGIPYKCASGNCGTDRVLIESGAEHCSRIRAKEHERLGPDIEEGYRLACQTYVEGDVVVTWDPERTPSVAKEHEERWRRHQEKLKDKWLSEPDTA